MADAKISALTDLSTTTASADWLPLVDATDTTTKKATIANVVASCFPAWTAFTPSWANITVGNGTNTGRYLQIGKTVFFYASLVWGNTTSCAGAVTLTLPVGVGTYTQFTSIGLATIYDNGGSVYNGVITKEGSVWVSNSSGTYDVSNTLSSTVPITWTTSDQMVVTGMYEAA